MLRPASVGNVGCGLQKLRFLVQPTNATRNASSVVAVCHQQKLRARTLPVLDAARVNSAAMKQDGPEESDLLLGFHNMTRKISQRNFESDQELRTLGQWELSSEVSMPVVSQFLEETLTMLSHDQRILGNGVS